MALHFFTIQDEESTSECGVIKQEIWSSAGTANCNKNLPLTKTIGECVSVASDL